MPLLYVLSDNDVHGLATQFYKYTHMYRHKYENTLFLTHSTHIDQSGGVNDCADDN